jgi:hypothetical protein
MLRIGSGWLRCTFFEMWSRRAVVLVGMALVGVLPLAACGGSDNSSVAEPGVEGDVVRDAGDDGQPSDDCVIGPYALCWNVDLSGANLSMVDLSYSTLTGANLSGADLKGTDLVDADLTDADLSGANLTAARLTGANLTGASLRDANLKDADLTGANLSDTDMSGVYFCFTRMPDGSIAEMELSC